MNPPYRWLRRFIRCDSGVRKRIFSSLFGSNETSREFAGSTPSEARRSPAVLSARRSCLDTLLVFGLSCAYLLILERIYAGSRRQGLYWQQWSTDALMQTLPIELLKNDPFRALLYLHIQPPFFDTVRALLAWVHRDLSGAALVSAVDRHVTILWGLCFGGIAAFVFAWASHVCQSRWGRWVVLACWLGLPSGVFHATLLDGTNPSALFVTWFLYEWWKLAFTPSRGSPVRSSIALALTFYTRTVFQAFYLIPHVIGCCLLPGRSTRERFVLVLLPVALCAPLVLKQRLLFGTTATTTFNGQHLMGVIWVRPAPQPDLAIRRALAAYRYPADAPSAKYNTAEQVLTNLSLQIQFRRVVATHPLQALAGLARSFRLNLNQFFAPSYSYSWNYLVEQLPQRPLCDSLLDHHKTAGWLFAAATVWLASLRLIRRNLRSHVAVLIPVGYVFIIINLANRYEWSEAVRLKFLLEPAIFAFVTLQFGRLPQVVRLLCSRPPTRSVGRK